MKSSRISRNFFQLALTLAIGLLACGREQPGAATATGAASQVEVRLPAAAAPKLPWTCGAAAQSAQGPRVELARPAGRHQIWAALSTLTRLSLPIDASAVSDTTEDALSWPFGAYYFTDGTQAQIFSPEAPREAAQQGELFDLVTLLRTRQPDLETVQVRGFRIVSERSSTQVELTQDSCQVAVKDLPGNRQADAELGMLSRRLSELGELSAAYRSEAGELVLMGPAREPGSPPALTLDDLGRAYRAIFHRCDCPAPPQLLEGHVCDGAFVSIDPDPHEAFAPAHVILAPCLRDSAMGRTFTIADALLKELASGYVLSTGDPLPVPAGHRTEQAFGVASPDVQRNAAWTRYWLFADPQSRDSFIRISDASDQFSTLYLGQFHLSLGIEITDHRGVIFSTDEREHGSRLRNLPAHQFADQINRGWLSRYAPYYPVLSELDNAARLIQVMGWLREFHSDDKSIALFERLPLRFEATPRRIALRAGATVSVANDNGAVTSLPWLTYGGVIPENLVMRTNVLSGKPAIQVVKATRSNLALRAEGASQSMPLGKAAARRAPITASRPVGLGLGEPLTAEPAPPAKSPVSEWDTQHGSPFGFYAERPPRKDGLVEVSFAAPARPLHETPPGVAPSAVIRPTPGNLVTEASPPPAVAAEPVQRVLNPMASPRGPPPPSITAKSDGLSVFAYSEDGTTTVSRTEAAMQSGTAPGASTGAAPARSPAPSAFGAGADRTHAPPPTAATSLGLNRMPMPPVLQGSTGDDDDERRRRRQRTDAVPEKPIPQEEGGVRIPSMIASALQTDPAQLAMQLRSRELVALRLPVLSAAKAPQGASVLSSAPVEVLEERPLMPILIDNPAGRIHVGFLHLKWPGLADFAAEKQSHPDRVRKQWQNLLPKDRLPFLMSDGVELGASIRTARALLSLRGDGPLLVAVPGSEPLDAVYKRLSRIPRVHHSDASDGWLKLSLYQFGPHEAAWQAVATAADVAAGPGIVAIEEDGTGLEPLIARLGLLGRLLNKQLVLIVEQPEQVPAATLSRLLSAGLVDAAAVISKDSSRAQLGAIADAVERGKPFLDAFAGPASEQSAVVLIGGR